MIFTDKDNHLNNDIVVLEKLINNFKHSLINDFKYKLDY